MNDFDPDSTVKLFVCGEVSHFGMDEKCRPALVSIDADGKRFVMITAKLAQQLLCAGAPSSWPLLELNRALADRLGTLKPEPGINIAGYQRALIKSMSPMSFAEIAEESSQMRANVLGAFRQ